MGLYVFRRLTVAGLRFVQCIVALVANLGLQLKEDAAEAFVQRLLGGQLASQGLAGSLQLLQFLGLSEAQLRDGFAFHPGPLQPLSLRLESLHCSDQKVTTATTVCRRPARCCRYKSSMKPR
jgi:hypothetical protein